MTKEEYIDGIKNAKDRYEYYVNFDNIRAVKDFKIAELMHIGEQYLSDEEKSRVILTRPFAFNPENPSTDRFYYKSIYNSIELEDIKTEIIFNPKFCNEFDEYTLRELLSPKAIEQLLEDKEKRKLFKDFSNFDYRTLIAKLDDDKKLNFLKDTDNYHDIGLDEFDFTNIVETIKNDDVIKKLLDSSLVDNKNIRDVLKVLDDKYTINCLEQRDERINEDSFTRVVSSLKNVDNIINVCNEFKELFEKYNCNLRDVFSSIYNNNNKQVDFLERIDEFNFDYYKKRECFVGIKEDVLSLLDRAKIADEYKKVLDLDYDYGSFWGPQLIFNLNRDVEEYRGLDKFLKINPKSFSKKERGKLFELAKVCPKIQIVSDILGIFCGQNIESYVNAEKWIDSIIDTIDPNMSDVQKIYIVDEAIGKKISYSPVWGKENEDTIVVRQLWNVINSGYGVCNGIAEVEEYMLNKIGIESEMIYTKKHAFLKIKNLNVDGKNVGNSILDPTWNLSENRVGDRPEWFLVSNDMAQIFDSNGHHKNDEKLQDANYHLDKNTMENELKGIGRVDKDGKFPFEKKLEALDEFYEKNDDPNQLILACLKIVQDNVSDFINCQETTKSLLSWTLNRLINKDSEKLKVREGTQVVEVYKKGDETRSPINLVQVVKENGDVFFSYGDKETNSFVVTNEEWISKNFSSYDVDKEKNNGREIWDLTEYLEDKSDYSEKENEEDKEKDDL